MSIITETPKGKVAMQNPQTLTVNGKAVDVTPTMLKASKNGDWLKQRVKAGRGAPTHTWTDVMAMVVEKVEDLKTTLTNVVNVYIEIGELLIVARAKSGQSDVAFGKTCSKLVPNLHRRDRAAMMELAANKHTVLKMVKAEETLSGMAADTIQRKLKAHAEETGTPLKAASERSAKGKQAASKRKAKAQAKTAKQSEATVGSSDTKAKAKPYDLDEAMSDMIEQALGNGKTLEQVMASFTKQWSEIKVAASLEA